MAFYESRASGSSSASGAGGGTAQISMQNLPALEGTERQVAYAEDLRKREIPRINKELQELEQLSDSDYINRVAYGINGENVDTPLWATNMGLGIRGEDGHDLFDSKSIVKIADDYEESHKQRAAQIRKDRGVSRSDARKMASEEIAHEYRKKIDKVLDMKKIADVIQSKTSAKWWIEKARAVKF